MARPRSFDEQAVVEAAKNCFRRRGYGATALGDLEVATGVSRSSLYLLFGSKRGLFEAALEEYEKSFIEPLLVPLEAPGAGLPEAAAYFTTLSALFQGSSARRGCMIVNAIAELAGLDDGFAGFASRFMDRYRAAFSKALSFAAASGDIQQADVSRRAKLLTASAIGAWVVVRADPATAAAYCRAVSSEIQSWARAGIPR
jgi:AcrR family transcriptional regulator